MTYHQKMVVSLRVNGRILREFNENGDPTVYLPFGSEYSVYLKNMESRKALVSIKVDGRDVIDQFILNPNQSTDIERFFEGDMNSGHKLKFIEKTDRVREHRGEGAEDGLLVVNWQFEEHKVKYTKQIDPYPIWKYESHSFDPLGNAPRTLSHSTGDGMRDATYSAAPASFNQITHDMYVPTNDDGITVEGSESDQQFTYGRIGTLESTRHSVVIKMKGGNGPKNITEPVTTRAKLKCKTCGTKNSSSSKFCSHCGTALF